MPERWIGRDQKGKILTVRQRERIKDLIYLIMVIGVIAGIQLMRG